MKHQIIKYATLTLLAGAVGLAATSSWGADDLHLQSKQAIENFQRADSTLTSFFKNSAGYAVFPSVGKGGFVVGGARGKGLVFEKDEPVGNATMTQASFGAQAGAQSFAEVIFFENPAALSDFKSGKFELNAELSAVVLKEGASSAAGYKKGVAVFTLPTRGVMAQASVGGQKFKYEPMNLQPTGRETAAKTND
jgi:lipid-binding SYLF domain-containing protein